MRDARDTPAEIVSRALSCAEGEAAIDEVDERAARDWIAALIISDQRRAAAEQRAAEQEARIARMGHTIDGLIRERDAVETALTEIVRLYEREPTGDAQETAARMHRVAVDALGDSERARAGERAVLEAADALLTNLDRDPAALAALRASDQTGEIIEAVERLRVAINATRERATRAKGATE